MTLRLRYSQVVRQRFLVPSCAGSNPANAIGKEDMQVGMSSFVLLLIFFSFLPFYLTKAKVISKLKVIIKR